MAPSRMISTRLLHSSTGRNAHKTSRRLPRGETTLTPFQYPAGVRSAGRPIRAFHERTSSPTSLSERLTPSAVPDISLRRYRG
eukprot:scaffold16485_cov140-Isochrysis_galbana.AAC.2